MRTLRAIISDSKTKEITLDGETLGTVEPISSSRWHASFRPVGGDSDSLIQGFGDTPEEAIFDGFFRAKRKLEKSIFLVSELRDAMYAE